MEVPNVLVFNQQPNNRVTCIKYNRMLAIEIGINQAADATSRAKDAIWSNERRIFGDPTIPRDNFTGFQ